MTAPPSGSFSAQILPPWARTIVRLTDNDGNPLPTFDEKYIEDFNGLAFIGALSKQFSWLGHTFIIRTLTTDEMLAAATITSVYKDTIGEPLAYKTAMVALCTSKVDGEDLPTPIGTDGNDISWAWQRFNYVKARWFQFTIDQVYAEYLELEEKTNQVVAAMGKAFSPTG